MAIRFCLNKECNNRFEDQDSIVCPKCGSVTGLSRSRKVVSEDSEKAYTEWDPPAAITVYCKRANLNYKQVKYSIHSNASPVELENIQYKLNSKEYRCENCNNNFENMCSKKKMKVYPKAICKSFEPHPHWRKEEKKDGK